MRLGVMNDEVNMLFSELPDDRRRVDAVAAMCGVALEEPEAGLSAARLMETLVAMSDAMKSRPQKARANVKRLSEIVEPYDPRSLLLKKHFHIIDGILRQALNECQLMSGEPDAGFSVSPPERFRHGPYIRNDYGPGWQSYNLAKRAASAILGRRDCPGRT